MHFASREKILIRTSWVSMVGNAVLSVCKIITGLAAGSLAVLGDGIDSATDVIVSVAMVFTAYVVKRPPDTQYAYGYDKAESVATKMLSLIIFYAGMQMLVSSVGHLFSGEPRALPDVMAIYVTVFSVIGKLGLMFYQYRQGKKADSPLLMANAVNMRNDVFISLSVLVGLLFTFAFRMPVLDVVIGFLISLFLIKSAIGIFMESNAELMDGVKDVGVYDKIFKAVNAVAGASNPHRVRSRQIRDMYMIVLDIEVDGNMTLNEAHEVGNKVEQSIRRSVRNVYDIVVHVEPKGIRHDKEPFGVDEQMLK